MNALQENDINKVYTTYTSTEFKEKTPLNEFQYFIESYPSFSKNKYAFFADVNFTKNHQATIQGILTSATNDILRVQYDLIKENALWKILYIQIIRQKNQMNPTEQELPAKPS
jgi:uncharacterized protein DUF4864